MLYDLYVLFETKMHDTSHILTFMCLHPQYIFCTFPDRERIATCSNIALSLTNDNGKVHASNGSQNC